MSDKTIKRIAVPAIIMLGSALMLGVADGIIYLLRNVIYGVLIFFSLHYPDVLVDNRVFST